MNFTVEAALVAQARADADALDELIRKIWPEVYRVALGILRHPVHAEDAAQEACAAIARALPNLNNDAAFYGWMYRITGRCAVAAAKARARTDTVDCGRGSSTGDIDAVLDLRGALAQLPAVQRSAVILHYYAGLSSGEIGAALGVPAATVRFHLMLARRRLRASLRSGVMSTKETCTDV